jgi:hypothetical protein
MDVMFGPHKGSGYYCREMCAENVAEHGGKSNGPAWLQAMPYTRVEPGEACRIPEVWGKSEA